MANRFIVNSIRSKERMQQIVEEAFEQERYVTFSWSFGNMATIKSKALCHIWLRQWAAFLLKKPEEDVSEDEIESIKRTVKARVYHDTAHSWLVHEIRELVPPYRKKVDYTSMKDWTTAQMCLVMEWMQATAANAGLVLESKGEFAEMKKSQNK